MAFFIQTFPSGPLETNAYIVGCKDSSSVAIIDPAPGSFRKIVDFIEKNKLIPEKILLTHSHWDHIADVFPLKEKYQLPVYVQEKDANNLMKPGSDGIPMWIAIEGTSPDFFLKEGDIISCGTLTFSVLETPGHSPGSVCFYFEKDHILISGDTLFKGSMGTLSLPTASPESMWESLKKLSTLPKHTSVFPGHGEQTTIGNEGWLSYAKDLFGND